MSAWLALLALSALPLDAAFERDWAKAQVEPALPAPDMLVYRRLALGLCGTVPSLEELRAFEADAGPDRLEVRQVSLLSTAACRVCLPVPSRSAAIASW